MNISEKSEINKRLDNLEDKLTIILEKLEKIDTGINKMNVHIDFINSVHTKIQKPLFWMCDKINYMRGYTGFVENKENNSSVEEQD